MSKPSILDDVFDLPRPVLPHGTIPLVPATLPVPPGRGVRQMRAVAVPPPPSIDLDDLPREMSDAIDRYLATPNPEHMLLLAFPAGAGKTTAMVHLAEKLASQGKRVIYFAPRHALIDDLRAIARAPSWWYEWQPRNEITCRFPAQINAWIGRGYQAIDFCSQYNVCGWKYIKTQCIYHRQAHVEHPIIVAQHAHAVLSHPLIDDMTLAIGDELPTSVFLNPIHIPREAIVPFDPDLPQAVVDLFADLQRLSRRAEASWHGAALIDALGGAQRIIDALSEAALADARNAPTLYSPDDVTEQGYAYVAELIDALAREAIAAGSGAEAWVERVIVTRRGVDVLARHYAASLPSHIIWCDATGTAEHYTRLFKRPVEIIAPTVAPKGTITQVHASLYTKRSIVRSDAQSLEEQANVARTQRELATMLAMIAKRHTHVAVISYKDAVETFAPPGAQIGHFYASRGTNAMEACDALIVVGTPMLNPDGYVRMAAMLHDDRIAPFDATWSTRDVPYVGSSLATDVPGFWHDDDLQQLLVLTREAEILQAINRSRPLRRETSVYLFSRLPLSIPTNVVNLAQLYGAVGRNGKPLSGIPLRDFPAIIALVDRVIAEDGACTAETLAERLDCSIHRARRMHETLGDYWHYRRIARSSGARGRPTMILVRDEGGTR